MRGRGGGGGRSCCGGGERCEWAVGGGGRTKCGEWHKWWATGEREGGWVGGAGRGNNYKGGTTGLERCSAMNMGKDGEK